MAQKCEICGKGPQVGKHVSHAHNVTSRRWHINLQRVRVVVGGTRRRMHVCSSCIRAGRVSKA